MPIFFVPIAIREVYFLFKDLFELGDYNYLQSCSLLLFFLLGCPSFSEFVRCCPWSPSVSTMSRMAENFKPNRFMRRNQHRILKRLSQKGHQNYCFAVDDTANPKYGSSVFGSAPFYSSSGSYFGQKILVLVVVDMKSHKAYPLSYVFLTGKNDPDHIPANERALTLLKEALGFGFPPMPVTADSWFDSRAFISAVHKMGCEYAGELKSNRQARVNTSPASSRRSLKEWFNGEKRKRLKQSRYQKRRDKRGKAYSVKTLFINNLGLPLRVIAVYNRMNGKSPFALYASTNPSMTGSRLWKLARARWAIEVLFRDLKQSLGFGRLTAGGEGGAHLSVCLPMILLTSIRLDKSEIWISNKKSSGDSLGTIVKKVREAALEKTIDSIIHAPGSQKLELLLARRKNPNQKPTNLCGGRNAA